MTGFTFKNTLSAGLKKYKDLANMEGNEGADFRAKSQVALQFLNVCDNGSAKEPVVPPIKTGNLRGSASVFVGPIMVQTTRGRYGIGKPATSCPEKMNIITLVWNTAYAAKMHEDTWEPGPVSEQSGDVGNKWCERHMIADGPDLLELYAIIFKKETGG